MIRSIYLAAALSIIFPVVAYSLELSPWYGTEFEFNARADYFFQSYQRVAKTQGSFHRPANDNFLNVSLGVPYYDWFFEADLLLADTEHRNFGMDCFQLEGRYQLLDDVDLADPLSLIISAVVSKASKTALHDISSFHHGQVETALYLSAGKEFSCRQFWNWHCWGVAGLGVADTGSPWLAYGLHLDHQHCDQHRLSFSLAGLYGFGGEGLRAIKQFKGYGSISHRSLDAGILYTYSLPSEIQFSIGYSYRLYARNFPENTHQCLLAFLYPFSI